MQNKNWSVFRGLLIALLALLPLSAITQTSPLDEDDFFLPAVIEAIRPACTILTASPVSPQTQATLTLTATCTKNPTSFEWMRDGIVIATTTTPASPTVAPATTGTYTYSVRAAKAKIWSPSVSTIVSVTAQQTLLTLTAPGASITLGSPIVFNGSANTFVALLNNGQTLGFSSPVAGTQAYSLSWTPTKAGVYNFKVVAGDLERYATVLVTEDPAAQPLTVPGTTSTAGATAGSFNVSDLGAAGYSIPITVPPGIAGMQPSLALSYNSQGGNGHLGVGWSLSGFSAISRCPKTIAQDEAKAGVNFDTDTTNDAYCLDGQRLMQVSSKQGTDSEFGAITIVEYRTEIDRFDRIESYQQNVPTIVAGPMNFKVFSKGGQVLQFGFRWWGKNSGFGQGTRANTIKTWPLDRVADRNGNYYVIDYSGSEAVASAPIRNPVSQTSPCCGGLGAFPGTELYPVQITYTMNSSAEDLIDRVNRIVFEYEDRPASDKHVLFSSDGGQNLISKRLKSIKTYVDGTRQLSTFTPKLDYPYVVCNTGQGTNCGSLVKSYQLGYVQSATGRSLLEKVTECAADGACLPNTAFLWSESSADFLGTGSGAVAQVEGTGADLNAFAEFTVADVDGDGRSDLVRRYGASGTGHIQALLWRANGYVNRDIYATSGEVAGPDGSTVTPMDLNGDGRADFVVFNPNPTSGKFRACITNPSATSLSCTSYPDIARPISDIFHFGDFDGDGKIDLLIYRGIHSIAPFPHKWDLHLGIPTGFNPSPVTVYTAISAVVGEFEPSSYSVGDFNGDGRADLISRKSPSSCPFPPISKELCFEPDKLVTWRVHLSMPSASGVAFVSGSEVLATNTNTEKNVTYDFNGDGLSDLVAPVALGQGGMGNNKGTLNVCLSAGDGTFGTYSLSTGQFSTEPPAYVANSLCKTVTLPSPWPTTQFNKIMFGDFNGDGRTDMMVPDGTWSDGQVTFKRWSVCLSSNNAPQPVPVGNVVEFSCSQWKSRITEDIGNTRIGDFNGDGKTDFVSSNASQVTNVVSFATVGIPDLMTRVTNGMQAYTDIEYAPLTDSSVYTKGTTANSTKIDVQSPMYVVKMTRSSNGLGGTFDTTYKYESLIAQTDGRGLLGFGKKTVEHENGQARVRTETAYFNDPWWQAGRIASVSKYVGVPANTAGTVYDWFLVNVASNAYELKLPSLSSGVYQVHLTATIERSSNLYQSTAATRPLPPPVPQALPFTITTTPIADIDQYGNVSYVKVETFEPSGAPDGFRKETRSSYEAADTANWIIGRLQTATVTHTMPGGATTTRKSSFDYYATNGQIKTEKVEPDEAESSDLWLTKAYTYDLYGNVSEVATSFADKTIDGPLAKTTRITRTKYCTDATKAYGNCTIDGRFPTRVEAALSSHVELRSYERAFGNMTETIDPNGIKTVSSFDGFGRKVAAALYDSYNHPLGFATTTYTPTGGINSAGGIGYTVANATHTGGYSRTTFDSLGREISVASRTFGGGEATSDTTYDTFGRKSSVSGPRGGVGGTSNYLTTTVEYDLLGRPVAEIVRTGKNSPSGTAQTSTITTHNVETENSRTYLKTAVTQTVTDSTTHTVTKYADSQGRTSKIIDNAGSTTTYGYDPVGNLLQVVGPGAISETMTYDKRGRKKTSTNANLSSNYTYNYNGAGELIGQTDPKAQTTRQQYDLLGRMTTRDEQGIVSTWTYDACANGIGKLCSTSSGDVKHEHTYDAQSRPQQVKTTIFNDVFVRTTLYNRLGQMSYVGYPQTRPGDQPLGLTTSYNDYGFASEVKADGAVDPYWTATALYDDGSFASGSNGAAPIEKDYDILGRLSAVRLKTAQSALFHTSTYTYDKLGNLTSRRQQPSGAAAQNAESFCYDALNRVTQASVSANAIDCNPTLANFTYGADGNLLNKNGATGAVGTITYGNASRTNNAGPHAVASAQGNNYFYDQNGNLESIKNGGNTTTRSISYTPFNLPSTIVGSNPLINGLSGNTTLEYVYDSAHARVKDVARISGQTDSYTTLHASSGFFEKASEPGGSVDYRHYMSGPDGTIGIHTVRTSPTTLAPSASRKFWFKDHLGSPVFEYTLGANSANVTTMGFDAWGLRRAGFAASPLTTADLSSFASPRGFTGHEHLDEVGLVHMNGRIYDPVIGRFLQMDPIVQEPYNSQNFNRYSYVLNNPLAFTDPTGYSFWTEVRRPVGAIVATWLLGPGAYSFSGLTGAGLGIAGNASISAIAAGFAAGGIGGGNIESALVGAFSAGMLDGIGSAVAVDAMTVGGKIVAHAVVGCIGAGVNGGSCPSGAMSGGFAAAAGAALDSSGMKGLDNAFTRALVGGASAQLGGGKFANGAFTGAFNYLLNDSSHSKENEEHHFSTCIRATINCAHLKNSAGSMGLEKVYWEETLAGGAVVKAATSLLLGRFVVATEQVYVGYFGVDSAGVVRYVGITFRNPTVRFGEHLSSIGTGKEFLQYSVVGGVSSATKIGIKTWEQSMINLYGLSKNGGQLLNKINSISPKYWGNYGL